MNGGVVEGSVFLAQGFWFRSFAGEANFSAVVAGGAIRTERGDIDGLLHIAGNMDGAIVLDTGRLLANGRIMVDGDVSGGIEITTMAGEIRVGGDVSGRRYLGSIQIEGTLFGTGRIYIDGSLTNVADPSYEVSVLAMEPQAAIVIDYDGWDLGDDWQAGATVRVGQGPAYTGNTPAAHVWEVQVCKGDCNNDGAIDTFDISAFVQAYSNPPLYSESFPGLEGSRVYHADCNCDGEVDAFDIAPFTSMVLSEHCYCGPCEDCQFLGGDGANGAESPATPDDVAALYRESLKNAELATFMESLAELVAGLGDSPEAEYWAQVLKLLEG